jgi:uncharacterized protein YqcC (DUF446 family)
MPDLYARVAASIAEIENEMKAIGYWSGDPLPPEAYDFRQAFAMDTMTFSQWLQFIFIQRVHQILDQHGEFPVQSMVGAQAVREFDGDPQASNLVSLLAGFDSLFNH